MVSSAYWICLLVGIVYTVIAFLLGGIGHGHAGDASVHSGVDSHGHALSSDADTGQIIFGPFSPLVIAFFLTCFGASGIVFTHVLHQPALLSLPEALIASVLLAWALISVFNRLLGGMQSSSEVKFASLVGTEAEVTVDVPVDGVGEIAYVAMGSRNVAPCRNEESAVIPRFTGVRITRVIGNMLYVRPLVEEKLRDLGAVPAPDSSRVADET